LRRRRRLAALGGDAGGGYAGCEVDFPIERDPADAWPDFAGWRANDEQAAYTIAYTLDVVPAMWSGPRRRPTPPITPFRPPPGRAK
jgi:hypothetical protein